MKHIVTVDSIFDALLSETIVNGANEVQVNAIRWLRSTAEPIAGEYNPYRRAELHVWMDEDRLRIRMTEAGDDGHLLANGEWCHISIDPYGTLSMTTSHDQERIQVMGVS